MYYIYTIYRVNGGFAPDGHVSLFADMVSNVRTLGLETW